MSDANYRIRYKKGDFEVEVQGDKAWVEEKFEQLKKDLPSKMVTSGSSTSQTATPIAETTALTDSLVEFLKSKGSPSSHIDVELLFAYWLLKKRNMESYNIVDIQNCYAEARITKPANITDVMNGLQEKGYAMPKDKKDGKKAWVITGTGEEYVEQMKA